MSTILEWKCWFLQWRGGGVIDGSLWQVKSCSIDIGLCCFLSDQVGPKLNWWTQITIYIKLLPVTHHQDSYLDKPSAHSLPFRSPGYLRSQKDARRLVHRQRALYRASLKAVEKSKSSVTIWCKTCTNVHYLKQLELTKMSCDSFQNKKRYLFNEICL